jgi:hypothetical protein
MTVRLRRHHHVSTGINTITFWEFLEWFDVTVLKMNCVSPFKIFLEFSGGQLLP